MIEMTAKAGMLALLALALPVATPAAAPELWAQWSLAGLVVGYTLWRDAQRERRMATAIEQQQR